MKHTICGNLLLGVLLAFCAQVDAATPAAQSGDSEAILLQSFHWNSYNYKSPNWYNILKGNADELADMGFTHVWFPPSSDSAHGAGYLPRQLNILSSAYGSADDLKNAISAFKNKGVKAVADIVVNHRVGTTDWADFTNPNWSLYSIVNNDECSCGKGNGDTGGGFDGGRDIDHTNVDEVQNGIADWLNNVLKPAGFSGIRFDYVKGYDGKYSGSYANAMGADFCVGELWDNLDLNNIDSNRQQIVDWVEQTGQSCGVFDFTTKGILNDALANGNYWRLKASDGKPQGVIGWWPSMSVTFVENHDTGSAESCGSGQSLWPMPCGSVMEGYAYILTHPGIPTVFYPHIYDWNLKSQIADLINVRRAAGVTSTSKVAIQEAAQGLYAAIISGNNQELAMKIGPNDWSPGSGWTLKASGVNYAVWTK